MSTGPIDCRVSRWDVNRVDPVFCPTLNALHRITPAFSASGGSQVALQMAEGKTRLHDGESIRMLLVMPDFPSRLVVDYFACDSAVQHLYPQLANPEVGITADRPRMFRPGETLNLGHPAWMIGGPYGTDMIIAVAASEPLFVRSRSDNAERTDAYLRDLQAAIETLLQRGVRLSAAVIILEALP